MQPGRVMEYELFTPIGFTVSKPCPFLVSVSGLEGTHVNGFSRRLPSEDWVVAVPLRPSSSPLFFEGTGTEGDGIWYFRRFVRHLLETYSVAGGQFIFVGVSNGGNAVLRFATLWPELCCGLIVITTGFSGQCGDLKRLHGLPIDMYVGNQDECGFYPMMLELEAELRDIGQAPPALLTVFDGAGHVCSPMVDKHLIYGKIWMMLLRCKGPGQCLHLPAPEPGLLSNDEILAELCWLGENIGLDCEVTHQGGLAVRSPTIFSSARTNGAAPNVLALHPRSEVPASCIEQTPSAALVQQACRGACSPSPRPSPSHGSSTGPMQAGSLTFGSLSFGAASSQQQPKVARHASRGSPMCSSPTSGQRWAGDTKNTSVQAASPTTRLASPSPPAAPRNPANTGMSPSAAAAAVATAAIATATTTTTSSPSPLGSVAPPVSLPPKALLSGAGSPPHYKGHSSPTAASHSMAAFGRRSSVPALSAGQSPLAVQHVGSVNTSALGKVSSRGLAAAVPGSPKIMKTKSEPPQPYMQAKLGLLGASPCNGCSASVMAQGRFL